MKIIHSGFDSLYFSIQGALSCVAAQQFERLKEQAVKDDSDVSFSMPDQSFRYLMKTTGKKGGYAYVVSTGLVGSAIAFKSSLLRDQHNGFVEISSASLLAHGWREALSRALEHVEALGFHVVDVSINRADYCIDFLNAQVDINPRDFIAHSRVKKSCYYESISVNDHVEVRSNHVEVRTVSHSNVVKSITLGKMPGRQVIVYNKRAEVTERRKFYWFDAWGIDPKDPTQTVHRVEVRAGKKHLTDKKIRTLEDFEKHIGLVLTEAVKAIRWVQRPSTDANVTRATLHPLWDGVATHMNDALAPYTSPLSERIITDRMRQNKCHEYKQQFTGNLGGYLGCAGVPYEDMRRIMVSLIADVADSLSNDIPPPMIKSYQRARKKWE